MLKIVVAISSFRSDDEVVQLVSDLYDEDYQFESVVVVCSAGGHDLALRIVNGGYRNCHVLPFDVNLGSSGNLYERFKAAAELGGDFMLALNHDANIDPQMFKALVNTAENCKDRIGALYPLRYFPSRVQYDLTGVADFPFRLRGVAEIPDCDLIDVVWSSSNGALYALEPFRAGLSPDASLWMGWEDYLYGLQLKSAGYQQHIVISARTVDDYEFKNVGMLGANITVSDKPLWYCYFEARNMALICAHRNRSFKMLFYWLLWVLSFPMRIFLFKTGSNRWNGIVYFVIGLFHGIINQGGKWRLP